MSERELVHQSERCKTKDRSLAARLQSAASTQFAGLRAAGRVCTNTSGDAGMKKASTRLLEQETQTPSPAPDLIPAESSTENLHWDWYSKRGHFTCTLTSRHHALGLIRVHTLHSARIHCCSHVIVCHSGLDTAVGVGSGRVKCRVDLRVRPI